MKENNFMNWIRCIDKMPPHTRKVLVGYRTGFKHDGNGKALPRKTIVTTARYSGGEWRFLEKKNKRSLKSERVMVWAEIPEFNLAVVSKLFPAAEKPENNQAK